MWDGGILSKTFGTDRSEFSAQLNACDDGISGISSWIGPLFSDDQRGVSKH